MALGRLGLLAVGGVAAAVGDSSGGAIGGAAMVRRRFTSRTAVTAC